MPKDTSGTVPISKNQRNKQARLAREARKGNQKSYGGKCTRCGQVSNSATTGSPHLGCPEDKSAFGFDLACRLRTPFIRQYVGPNGEGVWLSKESYERFEIEVDAALASVRNFSTENMRWENAYGEPINFSTREVLDEEHPTVLAVPAGAAAETPEVTTTPSE